MAAKIMKKVLDLKRQNKCKRLLSCLLNTDMQRLCFLWHYWKTLPFLSTPQVNKGPSIFYEVVGAGGIGGGGVTPQKNDLKGGASPQKKWTEGGSREIF